MQHDPGPACAENDFKLTRRGRNGIEIDPGNANSLIHLGLPDRWVQPLIQHDTATGTTGTGFHAAILFKHHGNAEPHKGADIGNLITIGADHPDGLP